MGSFEIQVLVSLVVVLGAAFVALICDYLKGKNERLRERNEELLARVAEREMLETMLERFQSQALDAAMKVQKEALRELLDSSAPSARALPQPDVSALPEARAVGAPPTVAPNPRRMLPKRVLDAGPAKEVHSPVIEWPVPAAESKARPVLPVEREIDPPFSLRPIPVEDEDLEPKTADEAAQVAPARTWQQLVEDAAAARANQPAKASAPAASPGAHSSVRVFQMPGATEQVAEPDRESPDEAVQEALAIDELPVPAGQFESQGLRDLLAARGAFRGLVVSISVVANGQLAPQECPEFTRLLSSVSRTVLTLRREEDFFCRNAQNEFVLIYPRETGSSAQRIIGRVKERLYDLQLRSLGEFSARFIWGAAESDSDARLGDLLSKARTQAQDFLRAQDAAPHRA